MICEEKLLFEIINSVWRRFRAVDANCGSSNSSSSSSQRAMQFLRRRSSEVASSIACSSADEDERSQDDTKRVGEMERQAGGGERA